MKAELLKLNTEQYGLQENKAKELESLYKPMLLVLASMEQEYNDLVIQAVTPDIEADAKNLRLRIAKVRINAEKAKTEAKAEYLRAGNAIQGAYNTVLYAVQSKEAKLKEIEKHSFNIEKERLEKLESERLSEVQKYEPLIISEGRFGCMDSDVWNNYINGVKLNFEQKKAAEEKAEADRIAAEKAEKERIAKIEAENKRLEKEAKEKERLAKIEREKIEKEREIERKKQAAILEKQQKEAKEKARIEAEKQAKINKEMEAKLAKEKAERQKVADELEAKRVKETKEKQEKEAELQALLNMGDTDKVKEMIKDLEKIKFSYSFKSAKNIKLYAEVNILIDKVINHINK